MTRSPSLTFITLSTLSSESLQWPYAFQRISSRYVNELCMRLGHHLSVPVRTPRADPPHPHAASPSPHLERTWRPPECRGSRSGLAPRSLCGETAFPVFDDHCRSMVGRSWRYSFKIPTRQSAMKSIDAGGPSELRRRRKLTRRTGGDARDDGGSGEDAPVINM